MRKLWLTLTDRRLGAAVRTLQLTGEALGDLAAGPAGAPAFFRPLRAALKEASAGAARPAPGRARAAAEDLAARLEKTFSDMALLGAASDRALTEALAHMQRACAAAPGLLSPGRRSASDGLVRAHCASGRKALALARTAADRAGRGFPENLKFSSIYRSLDAAFEALERCAEALSLA